jgi:energy-coupling factor transporter ATP-binding protein EcfA2
MLYLTRVALRNIRCFPELEIKFDEVGSSVLLVGDNGDGKSTVLRSLAMGLCDQSSAAALFRELPGKFVRRGSNEGDATVEVDLAGPGGWRYRIQSRFIALESFERIEQTHFQAQGSGRFRKVDQDEFPWSKIFVSGYGPGIRTFGNEDYSSYLAVDAVYSLFRYDTALQSPELVIRRLVDEASSRSSRRGHFTLQRLRETLVTLLHLRSPNAIELDRSGITVRGPWGREELAALGDGYRATTTWILDLISWWLLYDNEPAHQFSAAKITGIVIVDELEQHLHPRWQRTILPRLRELFPQIQFIIATHSPLVASSSPDITVHGLERSEHTTYRPYGWRAEDVYEMMGVPTSRSASFQDEVIAEFDRLDEKRLTERLSAAEKKQFRRLKAALNILPPEDPTRISIQLNNMVKSLKRERRT